MVASASEAGRVVTNGMSYHARDGKNANAAVVVSVGAEDFGRPAPGHCIPAGAGGQRLSAGRAGRGVCGPGGERAELPGGHGELHIGRVEPTYDRGVVAADLGALLPGELADTLRAGLRAYERKIAGLHRAGRGPDGP